MEGIERSLQVVTWERVPDLLAAVAIILCIVLRIVPTLILGVPFLPDPWVHISKADLILSSGHVNIWGDYDDHWPGLNILIALFALFPGFDTITIGRLVIPLLCSLSLVFFYLLLRHLTGSKLIALVGVLLLGFAAPLTLIMGTTYKEGLARFFLLAALFAFVVRAPKGFSGVLPVMLLLGVIILTHHISFLVGGAVVVFVFLSMLVYLYRTGVLSRQLLLGQTVAYLSIFGFALAYYVAFGTYALLLVDARFLAIGLTVYFAMFGLLNLQRIRTVKLSMGLKLVLLVICLVLLGVFLANFLFIPTFPLAFLSAPVILMLLPLITTILLSAMGFVSLDQVSARIRIFLSSWALALIGLLIFALISGQSSLNLILTYRLAIFSLAPICALAGVTVFVYVRVHPQRARWVQAFLLVGLLAVLPVTTLAFTQHSTFGYGCSITPPIQESNQWLATNTPPGSPIAGDHLFTYYLLYYLHQPVSIDLGFQLFVNGDQSTAYTFAGVHRYLIENGFWLQSGVQWVPISANILPWLEGASKNGLVFNNGIVQIYRRL